MVGTREAASFLPVDERPAGERFNAASYLEGAGDPAAALVNQLEYFAELSRMYFAKCNYQPTNLEELKAHDPIGHAMIRKLLRAEN